MPKFDTLHDLFAHLRTMNLTTHDLMVNIPDIIRLVMKEDNIERKIRFTYTNDWFGEQARKLHEEQGIPRFSYSGDAGFDLPIILDPKDAKIGYKRIWPSTRAMLNTGIILEFPKDYWGRIVHRSSTESQRQLRVIEGIIDDYRGEVLVQVHNMNTCAVDVFNGHKYAQMILARTANFNIEYADELRQSDRGANGFGSSGQ
jgi:dUTP pyrophosphatase